MKFKVFAIATLLAATFAGNAFGAFAWVTKNADGSFTLGNTANGPQLVIKPSANVTIGYESTSGISYSIGTWHSSGTKTYASTSGDARIYMYENATQTATAVAKGPNDPNTSLGTVSWGTGWTALK